jgi:hypothetical protein
MVVVDQILIAEPVLQMDVLAPLTLITLVLLREAVLLSLPQMIQDVFLIQQIIFKNVQEFLKEALSQMELPLMDINLLVHTLCRTEIY